MCFVDEYDEIINNKIQRLLNAGISPERIRPDGTYVMTKEEFMNAVNEHYEKRKLKEKLDSKKKYSEQEELYMNYVYYRKKK